VKLAVDERDRVVALVRGLALLAQVADEALPVEHRLARAPVAIASAAIATPARAHRIVVIASLLSRNVLMQHSTLPSGSENQAQRSPGIAHTWSTVRKPGRS
jgi:hypothetical protein